MTYYYAYINANNIVEQIFDMPAPISSANYIQITSHDETLIGKRYNKDTGKFETVTWYYYAILDNKDIVTQVTRQETAMPTIPDNMVQIQSLDKTLVGKWYDRTNKTFVKAPIHILADMSTDQINVGKQDKWLTNKLGEMDTAIAANVVPAANQVSAYDRLLWGNTPVASFSKRVSQSHLEKLGEYTVTVPFNTGRSGYMPKRVYVQLYAANEGIWCLQDNTVIVMERDDDGSRRLYVDFPTKVKKNGENLSTYTGRIFGYLKDSDSQEVLVCSMDPGVAAYYSGAIGVISAIGKTTDDNAEIQIGKFTYNENSVSFTIKVPNAFSGVRLDTVVEGFVY